MTERRFMFDAVAALYDRNRPDYPDPLFEDLISISGIAAGGRILEIGSGTGLATLPLAKRGFEMLCIEPGPAMAATAREKLSAYPRVEVLESTFEAWPVATDAFDLVISAQAIHWVDPEIRFAKSAEALHAHGALAIIGNTSVREQTPLRDAMDVVYARHAPEIMGPPLTDWYAETGPVAELITDSGRFERAEWRRYPWSRSFSATEYRDLLCTHSDHRMLAPDKRDALLAELSSAIEDQGGVFEVPYEAHLYVARVRGSTNNP